MKEHQNQEYLQQKVEEGYSAKDISKELGVSYKLVELYLRQYDIPFVPWRSDGSL
jgi:transposase